MKRTNIILIIIAVVVFVLAVVLIIRRNAGRWKTVELTDDAKDYLQIFHIDTSVTPPMATPYRYQTGAKSVKVDQLNPVTVLYEVGGMTYQGQVVPISKVIYENGRNVSYNRNTDFISITSLNQ